MTTIRHRTFARLPNNEIRKFEREDTFRACLYVDIYQVAHGVLERARQADRPTLAAVIIVPFFRGEDEGHVSSNRL